MKVFLKRIYRTLPLLWLLKIIRSIARPRFYKYLTINGKFKTQLSEGKKMQLYSTHDLYIEKEIFWTGIESEFEPYTLKVWMELASKANVIFDVGANTGVFSIVAGVTNNESQVYSFEPVPFNFNLLSKNVSANSIAKIFPKNVAVSDHSGTARMQVQPNTVNYINSLEKNRFKENFTEIEVPLVKLDEFILNEHIDTVDLIKIDVEGHEESVVNGAKMLLKKFKPTIILEILDNEMGKKMQTFFDLIGGYKYFHIDDERAQLQEKKEILTTYRTNYLISNESINI